ncbi:MAG: secondary thiamine-phosphate synthase enzyme YjbQ [Pseudomonadota bacterium]
MADVLNLQTRGAGLYEITGDLIRWLAGRGDGVVVLMVRHTSASLLVQENADVDVQADLKAFFDRLVPRADDPRMGYLRHTLEGADDMPAHIKAAMMPVTLSIPVQGGHPMLGTWQGVYVFEHRDQPHHRTIAVSFLPTG